MTLMWDSYKQVTTTRVGLKGQYPRCKGRAGCWFTLAETRNLSYITYDTFECMLTNAYSCAGIPVLWLSKVRCAILGTFTSPTTSYSGHSHSNLKNWCLDSPNTLVSTSTTNIWVLMCTCIHLLAHHLLPCKLVHDIKCMLCIDETRLRTLETTTLKVSMLACTKGDA